MIKYFDLQAINKPYEHAADEVLRSGWYLKGDWTRRFEEAYAEYIGTRHCIGCGNGLDALTLIFRAYKELGIMKDGDEVIVPANTYIASILAITENRLRPVLVEPSLDTLQIDDVLIEQAITPRTRAIMIVHLYGRCAYTDRIGDLCRKYGLKLIEDNAQAHGCVYHGDCPSCEQRSELQGDCPRDTHSAKLKTGSLGSAAGHSFYPTKNLGAFGDAGAVTTDDDELADVIRALGNYGSARHYVFDYQGRNSRMDEIQAAILLAKLPDLDANNQRRREIAARYEREVSNDLVRIPLSDLTGGQAPCEVPVIDPVYHIFPVLCARRDELQQYLLDNGVGTEIHYPIPPHRQRCYAKGAQNWLSELSELSEWSSLSLPITEQIHAQELSIPCNQALTDDEVTRIIDLLNSFK
ncbi:MAG: DegT/DnrJ/EryC1/StrS family aminotransferase [Prevotella sp.]|nr:DegT/DnrJ/EryC1/StrS family aminotransferase [Prevotella sp.]